MLPIPDCKMEQNSLYNTKSTYLIFLQKNKIISNFIGGYNHVIKIQKFT